MLVYQRVPIDEPLQSASVLTALPCFAPALTWFSPRRRWGLQHVDWALDWQNKAWNLRGEKHQLISIVYIFFGRVPTWGSTWHELNQLSTGWVRVSRFTMSQWFSASSLENGHSCEAQGSFLAAAVTALGLTPVMPPLASCMASWKWDRLKQAVVPIRTSSKMDATRRRLGCCLASRSCPSLTCQCRSRAPIFSFQTATAFQNGTSDGIPLYNLLLLPSALCISIHDDCRQSLGSCTIDYHWPVHMGHSAEARPTWQASHWLAKAPLGIWMYTTNEWHQFQSPNLGNVKKKSAWLKIYTVALENLRRFCKICQNRHVKIAAQVLFEETKRPYRSAPLQKVTGPGQVTTNNSASES